MLKIKLAPFGKKHDSHYRLVVTEGTKKLTGSHQDILGHYHPLLPKNHPGRLILNRPKVSQWLKLGAQPTARIRKILRSP